MPIFEFICEACGESFEELVRGADSTNQVTCPRCGAGEVKKKISSFASRIAGGNSTSSSFSQAACSPAGGT